MGNNTKIAKPAKPYPEFPLFPHATGRWAKKVRGKTHYFGPWADPVAALQAWEAQRDYLLSGRRPPANLDGYRVKDLANRFLTAKQRRVEARELTARSWRDYKDTCDIVVAHFGKDRLLDDLGPEDFEALRAELAKGRGAISLGNNVQRVRSLFKFALENKLVDRAVVFGSEFTRPSGKTKRIEKLAKGERFLEAAELRRLIAAAGDQLKAMILLGINCGFGNSDVGNLPIRAIKLAEGWIDFPRPKTGIARRAALWPETVQALRAVLATRKEPKLPADKEMVFITKRGGRWSKSTPDNPVAKEMTKLLKAEGLHRPGLGFYTLRHTFLTQAEEMVHDQAAVKRIMGHSDPSMAAHYRERISDARLRAVADAVRNWLFPPTDGVKAE